MTRSIGNIPISSIQNIEISSSEENEEIDLLDEDVNFVFIGSESADEIGIDFSLYEQDNVTSLTLEEQRDEIKELIRKEDVDNTFEFNGKRGRISVEDVNFPQDAQESNLVSGTIEGNFLSWPKHFPNNFPSIVIFLSGEINGNHKIHTDLLIEKLLDGSLDSNFNTDSDLLIEKLLDGEIDSSFVATSDDAFGDGNYGDSTYGYTNPILSLFVSVEGSVDGTFEIGSSLYGYNYGTNYSGSEPVLSLLLSVEGTLDSELQSSGDLRMANLFGYGDDYGNDYGGLVDGYGSEIYDRGVYGEG